MKCYECDGTGVVDIPEADPLTGKIPEAKKCRYCNGTGDTPDKELISSKCDELKAMLLEKNRKYGNSALEPLRVFSRADAVEQILVRIDDKLNRIQNRQNDEDEDVIMDLAGYLILLMVAREKIND